MSYDDLITSAAQQNGLDPATLKRFVQIESGGNPRATTGSYSGLLQLSPSEFASRGGHNIYDPAENLNVGAAKLAQESAAFSQKYGRQPDASDLYLIHQQGSGGAAAHMATPSAPAWQNMYSTGEGRAKGPGWSKLAIWGNVPDQDKARFGSVDNVSSQDFMNLWRAKVMGGNAATTDAATAAPTPAATAQAGAQQGSGRAPLSLAGLMGVDTGNIGGTGVSLSGAGLSIPGVGAIGGGGGGQQQQASLSGPETQPMSLAQPIKQLDMRGILALARQPQLGLLTGAI